MKHFSIGYLITLGLLTGCAIHPPNNPGSTDSPTVAATAASPTSASPTATPPTPTAIDVTTLPGFIAPKQVGPGTYEKPMVDGGTIKWTIFDDDNRPTDALPPTKAWAFGASRDYTEIPGVIAWRGDHTRNSPAWGEAKVSEKKLAIA